MPGRVLIGKELDKVLATLKQNVEGFLSQARRLLLCGDIWLKKGLTSSYLGVTAHFCSNVSKECRLPTLLSTLDSCLKKYWMSGSCHTTKSQPSSLITWWQHLVEIEEGESDTDEREEEGEERDDDGESLMDVEVDDFERKELDHEVIFLFNRLSCFAHHLQLVVRKFDGVSSYRALLQRVHSLLKRVNMSTRATERLVSLCGRKLIRDCPTRWSSTFLVIEKLLQVKSALATVLQQLEWDNLPTSDWKLLENVHRLLKPFAIYASLISGEVYLLLSLW